MKRNLSFILVLFILLSLLPLSASAAETYPVGDEIIRYDDGSYMIITYTSFASSVSTRATSNPKTGYTIYTYYNSDDVAEWKAVLKGTFTYDGTTSTCTSSNCSVTIYNDAWYVISKSASKSGNTATATVVMGRKFLGVTIAERTYNMSLSCDKNGNIS